MAVEVTNISSHITEIYDKVFTELPSWAQNFINMFLLVVVVTLFCIFVWKIYTITSKKNIFELNLGQYNRASHPFLEKFLSGIFYILEYIVIFPIFIFFWFSVFTLFLMLLTKGLEVHTIIMISATIVMAIRATAYYKEALSRDLAKLLPFTLLGIAITQKGFFNFEEILNRFTQIPMFLGDIFGYLAIIVVLEIILRAFDLIFSFFGINDEASVEELS